MTDRKKQFRDFFEKTQTALIRKAQKMDPAAIGEWFNKAIQKQGTTFFGTFLTVLLCTYFLSNITSLMIGKYIPDPPVARTARIESQKRIRTFEEYNVIVGRNLLSSDGKIGGDGSEPTPTPTPGGEPVKTTLPFNLIGTLILENEIRSVATIEDKSASMVYPVRMEDEIPSKARIIKIEPRRVVFINISNGQPEYVELPEEPGTGPKISLGTRGSGGGGGGAGIEQASATQFNVSRGEVDRAFADLNNVLTQARAVPNFENGVAQGYKLFQIVPGSIFEKLGLKNGDVIMGFDGQTVNDPGKAFEAMTALKSANHLDLQIKRDGRPLSYSYDIVR